MKRWTALFAAVVLLMALTACNRMNGNTGSSMPNTSIPGTTSEPGTSSLPGLSSQPGTTSEPATSAPAETNYKDGTYTAQEKGYGGQLTVEVTVKDKKISDVKVVSHSETENVGTKAIDQLPEKIVAANSADVDVVSGATVTSEAIRKAVSSALAEATNK